MDIILYLRLIQRWFWLIGITAIAAAGLSYVYVAQQENTYSASATVAIGSAIFDRNPDSGASDIIPLLATTYSELLRTNAVLQPTVDEFNLPEDTDDLEDLISTNIIPDTPLMTIDVTYTDQDLVADITNKLVDQLILESPTNRPPEEVQIIEALGAQTARLTAQIDTASEQLDVIEEQLEAAEEGETTSLELQRDRLVNQITLDSATLAQLYDTLAGYQERANSIEPVEMATRPDNADASGLVSTVGLAIIVGAGLGVLLMIVLEYTNNAIRNPPEADAVMKIPSYGAVMSLNGNAQTNLITPETVTTPKAERYRTVRTNLLLTDTPAKTGFYLVTSASSRAKSSYVLANLAISMALDGLEVVLIDGNYRNPIQHELFNLKNEIGLSELLSGTDDHGADAKTLIDFAQAHTQETNIEGLRVMTSGTAPQNPAKLLGSETLFKLAQLIQTGDALGNVDVVLLDAAPSEESSDAVILAANVQASVILVVSVGKSRQDQVLAAKHRFDWLAEDKLGMIVVDKKQTILRFIGR